MTDRIARWRARGWHLTLIYVVCMLVEPAVWAWLIVDRQTEVALGVGCWLVAEHLARNVVWLWRYWRRRL